MIPSREQSLLDLLRNHPSGGGPWEGRLSASALSTAVAAFTLHHNAPTQHAEPVARALTWLAGHVNQDGGWGDTVNSDSNLSTTLLCRAALRCSDAPGLTAALTGAEAWITRRAGSLAPAAIAAAVLDCYGHDRTFSAPILTMCALAGCLGPEPDAWRLVPCLPFELAALPTQLYRRAQLPMVSYALPALIAMGLVRQHRHPSHCRTVNWCRRRLTPRLLDKITELQPANGGFLEAAPLTAFVAMSLGAAGAAAHPATRRAVAFLSAAIRPDGSWPIDTNLKTWVTTQAVAALGEYPNRSPADLLGQATADAIRDWLLVTQQRVRHPSTLAAPGGWAWTDLPGGVPDADDTAGALVALHRLSRPPDRRRAELQKAAAAGLRWLQQMQNRDGGMPTFCRGWNRLPFDRSCPDITAHALNAMLDWRDSCPQASGAPAARFIHKALAYLQRSRNADGSWTPLWFGNQRAPGSENRLYGTARVIPALTRLAALGYYETAQRILDGASAWLIENRNDDGGWGAVRGVASSIEETALAVQALAKCHATPETLLEQGLAWLGKHMPDGRAPEPTPIGLYFARLWYGESLYPVIFALAARGAVMARRHQPPR